MANDVWTQFRSTWLTTCFSFALFCAVTYLLFWNESQAILTSKVLDEIAKQLHTVDPFSPKVDMTYHGRLVHFTGPIEVIEPVTEPDYNIQVLSVKLKKRVQMYQWIEEYQGDETYGNYNPEADINNYNYYTDWRDYLVDSNLFYISPGHHNPKDMPISSQTFIADIVKIGRIFLSMEVKKKFSDYYDVTSDERPDRHDIKLHAGAYYHGADPLVHEVGDLRVMFSYAGHNNDDYSVIGVLERTTLQPYIGEYSTEPLIILRKGIHSPKDMLALEFRDIGKVTWRYRAVGWFQMFAAAMSLHPDWFTLLLSFRWVSSTMRSRGRVFINLVFATCTTLLIISSAWIIYAPAISLSLIFIAVLPFIYFSNVLQYVVNRSDTHDQ